MTTSKSLSLSTRVMREEHLFWDNATYLRQLGIGG